MTTSISALARRAASGAAARLRQKLGLLCVEEVECSLAEDGATVLIYALAPGRTVTTVVKIDQLGGTEPEAFAQHIERALAR